MKKQAKEINSCMATQENIQRTKDYTTKNCKDCNDIFYINKNGRADYCCICRYRRKAEKQKNKIAEKHTPLAGFPRNQTFATRDDMLAYIAGDGVSKIQCLECGHWFGSLGVHLSHKHILGVRDYKRKYGIPFTGHGLTGQRKKKANSDQGKVNFADKSIEEMQENAAHMRKSHSTKDRNLTEYYSKERSQNAFKGGNASFTKTEEGKTCKHPCSICGEEMEVSVIAAISNSCKIACSPCKKVRRREDAKRSRDKMRAERPEEYAAHLKRMRDNAHKYRSTK